MEGNARKTNSFIMFSKPSPPFDTLDVEGHKTAESYESMNAVRNMGDWPESLKLN